VGGNEQKIMSGWLRYFTLKAQVSTGLSPQIAVWAIIAVFAAVVAIAFLLAAAFIWLADAYGGAIAGLVLGGLFALIAVIAVVACLMIRRRNMERARLELMARSSSTNWLDPKLLAMGYQAGQAIGWRKLVSLAAVALLAAGLAKEWSGRDSAPADEPPPES
jgi:preprotein translocase subunit Sec61beta